MATRGPRGKIEQAKPLIIAAIKKGLTYKLAAEMASVAETTLHRWLRQGKKATHGKYRDFYLEVQQARAQQAELMLIRIEKHTQKDWKACAWMLERVHGYHRDGIRDLREQQQQETQQQSTTDIRSLLVQQSTELKTAASKAAQSESWQAYAALQRQLLSVLQQLMALDANEVGEQTMTDEQLLNEIQGAVLALPPVLRQRLQGAISNFDNIVSISRG